MTQSNNNLSVLPWYDSIDQQNARKWWVYDRVYPLFVLNNMLMPWQLIIPHADNHTVGDIDIMNGNTGEYENSLGGYMTQQWTIKEFPEAGYDVIVYPGLMPADGEDWDEGRHYLEMEIDGKMYYSEIFTVVQDIMPYLKIEWWDMDDFVMDAGTIVYKEPLFKNKLYLPSDIAKPEYLYEEEAETRDGYYFPIKQISEKKYKFHFLAPEYLLDVMRFIRLSDQVRITYNGRVYMPDSFLITPEWEGAGDIANVEAEFETDTVAKKLNQLYLEPRGGSFNDGFNNDFDNLIR